MAYSGDVNVMALWVALDSGQVHIIMCRILFPILLRGNLSAWTWVLSNLIQHGFQLGGIHGTPSKGWTVWDWICRLSFLRLIPAMTDGMNRYYAMTVADPDDQFVHSFTGREDDPKEPFHARTIRDLKDTDSNIVEPRVTTEETVRLDFMALLERQDIKRPNREPEVQQHDLSTLWQGFGKMPRGNISKANTSHGVSELAAVVLHGTRFESAWKIRHIPISITADEYNAYPFLGPCGHDNQALLKAPSDMLERLGLHDSDKLISQSS
jgi:hypothetical protein